MRGIVLVLAYLGVILLILRATLKRCHTKKQKVICSVIIIAGIFAPINAVWIAGIVFCVMWSRDRENRAGTSVEQVSVEP